MEKLASSRGVGEGRGTRERAVGKKPGETAEEDGRDKSSGGSQLVVEVLHRGSLCRLGFPGKTRSTAGGRVSSP